MASTGTGVVIGSHSLKVVQLRMKGGVPRLTRVANLKFDAGMAERPFDAKKQEHIRVLLEGAGFKPGETMVGLTGRDLIVRYTHVPPVPDWRLDMLMKFEIEEVSEQSGGEVSADWARLDIDETVSGENTILVALAKNASLLPRMALLKKAGLRIRGACPNSIGMFHSFVSTAKLPAGEATLLMHVGAENTDIAIQKDGKLLFARNVSGGGGLFTEAIMQQFNVKYDRAEKMKVQKADVSPRSHAQYEDSMAEKVSNAVLGVTGQFVSMVHSSVMFCKAQTKLKDLSVDRVVLAGGGANLKGFPEYLAQNLGIPVEIFDPMKAADLSALPPDQAGLVEEDGPGLAVAFGLAALCTAGEAFSIEILPEEYRKRRNFLERDSFMIGAGAVTAVLIAILFFTSARDHAAANAEYSVLASRKNKAAREELDYQNAVKDYRENEKKWIALRRGVGVGPDLTGAESLVDGVLLGGKYNALHVSQMETEVKQVDVLPKEGALTPALPAGQSPPKKTVVRVRFRAEIQALGVNPNNLYAQFMGEIGDAVHSLPNASVESAPLQQRNGWFDFWIAFEPAKE